MSDQDSGQIPTLWRPTTTKREDWKAYWKQQGQTWRIETEISKDRQTFLTQCIAIKPDFKRNLYPFSGVRLSRADVEWLCGQKIVNLMLMEADLREADLKGLPLEGINLQGAHLERASLVEAHLEGAILVTAHLERANLVRAHLEGADLERAYLQRASLGETHLEGVGLFQAHLEGCDLTGAFLDMNTALYDVILGDEANGSLSVIGVHWGEADLSVVDWIQITRLGDEITAAQPDLSEAMLGEKKGPFQRFLEYRTAVRANRQLSVALRNQGLNEETAHFAYRAQMLQREVFRYQRKFGQYLFSLFLDLLSGYGYKPVRSFIAYLIVIAAFATAYFIIGHTVGPALSPLGAWVFSMTSFHGRGFFPGGITLDDPLTILAALEAFVWLLIEVTFIATLTQRLFGK